MTTQVNNIDLNDIAVDSLMYHYTKGAVVEPDLAVAPVTFVKDNSDKYDMVLKPGDIESINIKL